MRYFFIILGCAAFIGLIKYWIPMIDAIIAGIEKVGRALIKKKK
ncbi:MAG: hypothetical protein QNL28_03940 [Flavobacteriaceae bacterium]